MNAEPLLHYRWHRGKLDSPTLLLIHPLGADHRFWDDCIECWGDEISALACDLRSAGKSPGSEIPVTLEHHVRDLELCCQALGIHNAIPIGCAVGAMTAACFAEVNASPALIMVSPTPKTVDAAAKMLADRAAQIISNGIEAILPGAVDKAFEKQPRDLKYHNYYQRFAKQDPQAYAISIQGILDADITKVLSKLLSPTLVVAAGNDQLLPPALSQTVHALVKNSEFTLMPEAAHFAPYQQPELFSKIVLSFLKKVDILKT